ncbi:cation-translocating P-type ATPase [Methylophilus medardicus]|uniref:Cation-translocating P-type ATPase n=1 Tax=Methylophilus medardicus TaxID=2588534 RepID=A0A5B8CV40_9PROT|nr:cation-translocating P-type ATPase [Methylophilus medardicus]QDC44775.1 cation-translocating P-type ATPase [Methylophilus medardicus]QDC49782.1 cation-translocating P-type ATPase [Methylophilus medardicus]QDC53487.1 cation-translocating P-type ATPase [Methylophilus medardicus]
MPAPQDNLDHKLTPITAENVGLTSTEAAERLKTDGYNELTSLKKRGFFSDVLEIIRQPMFALLIGGGLVYLLLGDRLEALFLLVFACLSVAITIVQESRSERVLEALRNLASPRATVIRGGHRISISGREVVIGDVMVITEGDRVAADAGLISAHDLLLDESLLTGESVAVSKSATQSLSDTYAGSKLTLSTGVENSPFIFAGALVVRGTGLALVHATGARSEMGKIGGALNSIDNQQPHLQKQLQGLVRNFSIIGAFAGGIAVLLYGILRDAWLEAMLSGIALGMSLLPEEFPLVMAVFMAMGAWRISKARVLTRRASSIESLGATTVLCSDKTGTLTENKMSLVAIQTDTKTWLESDNSSSIVDIQIVLKTALLACSQQPTDPMDIAIHTRAKASIGEHSIDFEKYNLVHAYGLRPDCWAVANIFTTVNGEVTVYAKGALETITALCHLTENQFSAIQKRAEKLAMEGIRVLGVAQSKINDAQLKSPPEKLHDYQFEYVGLIGFADPLRSNVPAAVAECRKAGIRVMMITGDYPTTALAIGRQAGLDSERVLKGDVIEQMTDDQLIIALKVTSIFARIRPNQKLRIVQLLKKSGEVVAMTGDGVNDAPAIKAADIGIAMGGRGTDVAREASSIVLLDDDFGSIVKTIRLGRRIYDNLRKAIEYIIAVHIPIAGLAIMPLLFGMPLILTPVHIAFLEMIIDPACSVVFEAEAEEDNVMQRSPRDSKIPLVLPKRIIWAVIQGSIVIIVLAIILFIARQMQLIETDCRTLLFTSLVILNMGLILINRSFSASILTAVLKPNRSLWVLLSSVSAILAITVAWLPARKLFQLGQFHWHLFSISIVASLATLLTLEAIKWQWFRTANQSLKPA